ncbi:BlaI/MecI/CopY family transcriptional regulator [Sorangium sp. So ce260]|uniref:BlaI/MecI/CopY family transcriptional regulator n=1 Tax=Sorangium sp. So ce260 TaxID=3133291 RepID=UPI003F61DE2E
MGTETLTDLQLAVMRALWEVGEGTVGDILTAMAKDGRALAPTTVATLLQRLSKQGWVEHRRRGRQFVYRAKVNQKEAAKGVLHRVVSSFFGGKVSALTAQLLESEQISPDELEEMRRLLKKKGG